MLNDVQSLNLKGILEDLAALWEDINDIHAQPFLSMPIIKEIVEELNIWGVRGSNTVFRVKEGNRPRKKRTKSKKSVKEDVESTKASNI